jgi:hypothetical protein
MMASDAIPNFFKALEILMPPPPGSTLDERARNFFSGTNSGTEILLSNAGLSVMVIILGIA